MAKVNNVALVVLVVVEILFLTVSVLNANPKKTTLLGIDSQSRSSWSAE